MKTKCTPEERALLDAWPVVTEADIQEMNDLFPHYIFYRPDKMGVSFWTSCCGRSERLEYIRRTEFSWETELLSELGHNRERSCPWCGASATLKDLRKSGKRKSLEEYRYAILLHAREDALYGDAVVLNKRYETEQELTASPTYCLSSMYRFALGDVMEVDYQDGGWLTHERERLGRSKLVKEPFKSGSIYWYSYSGYAILNRAALAECPVTRYCGYFDIWRPEPDRVHYSDFVSYLIAYCIYPRQIELLVKARLEEPVRRLITDRKKFADAIKWEEPDVRKAIGLTRAELREVIAKKPPMEVLELRNLARRWLDLRWNISESVNFRNLWGDSSREVLSFCRCYKLDYNRLWRYLEDNCVVDADLPWLDILDVFHEYRDYLEAAWALGRCMEHSKVLWPENLHDAHDRAADEAARKVDVKVRSGSVKNEARRAKYSFELDGLRIVFPLTAASIRHEGMVLKHCVGGYADRHIKGVCTILFLRRVEEPNNPYVTIEMDGNRLVQVHGYLNDRGAQSPRVTHKKFFETWLAWLKAGSKRDKDGKPVLPGRRKEEAA